MLDQARLWWEFIRQRWEVDQQVEPSVILLIAAVTASVVAVPHIWRFLRQASTIIHEMGHVLAAWATGRRVSGIKLHTDTSGVTVSAGKPRGFGMLITTLAGYPAPGLMAVLMASLASAGHTGAALTVYQVIVALALVLSRNLVGIVSCAVSLVATGLIWWHNDPTIVAHTVVALAVFYGIAGVRGSVDLMRVHIAPLKAKKTSPQNLPELREKARSTDAGQASTAWLLLPFPAVAWLSIFTLISTASAIGTVWFLAS